MFQHFYGFSDFPFDRAFDLFSHLEQRFFDPRIDLCLGREYEAFYALAKCLQHCQIRVTKVEEILDIDVNVSTELPETDVVEG